jgi:large subunit ribosomal protein L23
MNKEAVMSVLLGPVISEKTALAVEGAGQYAFRVRPRATKREIGKAVELLFDVEVDAVQVLNVQGKRKRFGGRLGKRPDWRKAYVRLKPGHQIEVGGGA